jgi:putative ABC transport system substrate-binding protein
LSPSAPVAYGWREHVTPGGLLSYGADLIATYRHVATYVDKILKGARPRIFPLNSQPSSSLSST